MANNITISLKNISKVFKRYHRPIDRLKEIVLPGKSRAEDFWALRNINLEVAKGETVGIIGRNGSGKSTLLQIIAGTLQATTGEVQVNGRISALLELGSGFNPEFTGRQNVYFNGRVLGLSQNELENRFDEIAAFADIGDFIDQPVKTYSSGMFVRLAFAVAINVDPDILIVDEALSVGDMHFQQRCITKIQSLRDKGVSIFFVSHDLDAVKRLCNKAAVIDKGLMINQGPALEMSNWYVAFSTVSFDLEKMIEMEKKANDRNIENLNIFRENHQIPNSLIAENDLSLISKDILLADKTKSADLAFNLFRHGDGNAKITKVMVENCYGKETESVFVGERITLVVETKFFSDQSTHLVGVVIRDRLGTDIIGINTYQEKLDVPSVTSGKKLRYEFEFDLHIKPGHYGICPSISYGQYSARWLDWIDNALVISVLDSEKDRTVFGVYLPPKRNLKVYACS